MKIVSLTEQYIANKAIATISEITVPSNAGGSYESRNPILNYMDKINPYMGREMLAPLRQERKQSMTGQPSLDMQKNYIIMDMLNPARHMYN